MGCHSITEAYLDQLSPVHVHSVLLSVDTPPLPSWGKPNPVSAKRSGGDGCDSDDGVDAGGGVSLRFPLSVRGSGGTVLV